MWPRLATIRRLLLAFLSSTLLRRNIVTVEAGHTAILTNVSSTVITEPLSHILLQSSVDPETLRSTQLLEMRNTSHYELEASGYSKMSKEIKDIMVNSTALLYSTEPNSGASEIREEISTQISSNIKMASSSVYGVESTPQMIKLSNSKPVMDSTAHVQDSTTTTQKEAHSIIIPEKERNENVTQVIVSHKHSESMVTGSFVQSKHWTIISNVSGTTLTAIDPRESKISTPLASSSKREKFSVTSIVYGKTYTTDTGNKRSEAFAGSVHSEESLIIMQTMFSASLSASTVLEILPNPGKSLMNATASIAAQKSKSTPETTIVTQEDASVIFSRANKSYIRTEGSASYSKKTSEEARIPVNSTTRISSTEVLNANKTVVLEPSPPLVTKRNRSKSNLDFTSPAANITELLYSKMSNGRVYPTLNDTRVQHGISKSALLTYNHTLRSKGMKEKRPGTTISLNETKAINIETSNARNTKVQPTLTKIELGNITKSSFVVKFQDNKTLIPTPMRYMSSGIPPTVNRTTITGNELGQFGKDARNQTHITTYAMIRSTTSLSSFYRTITNSTEEISAVNFATYGVIQPSGSLSSVYKTVTNTVEEISRNRTKIPDNFTTYDEIQSYSSLSSFLDYKTVASSTEDIPVLPSTTITKIPHTNFTIYASASTYSTRMVETIVEMKPTRTVLLEYNSRISTTPKSSPKLKAQQFRVTFKITSETFRNEYITSARAFRQKSREIQEQFDHVFRHVSEYLFTEVLRFFSGSLGCDVVIHTESAESGQMSVKKINNTLNQAKNEGGFGKLVVGDIVVEEKNPDVQGRDEDKDEKKTWGRMPVIVVSILGGVCLVLLVMVISQCIQKRHYSHSLADSNEIQEYSPDIQLKYNDDNAYKDEERVPMTTFNQTDIY